MSLRFGFPRQCQEQTNSVKINTNKDLRRGLSDFGQAKKMKLTREILEKGKSSNGMWSKKQLECFGLDFFKLKKGWKQRIIGKEFSFDTIQKFLSLRDVHVITAKIFDEAEEIDEFEFATKGL